MMRLFAAAGGIVCALFLTAAEIRAQEAPAPETPAAVATATPSAEASEAPGPPETGGFDASKLTPEQQQALQLAIIKTSQNPVGNITVFPFQNNFNFGVGPYTRYQYNLNVQPVFPIMLSTNMNLIARTIIPVLSQPSFAPPAACAAPTGCPWTSGISDVQEQLFFAPKTKPGQFIWGAGPIFQFPTATPNTLGTGKWSVGPDAVGLLMPGNMVLGALVTQLWSFAGLSNRANVSSFLVQPFINYNLKGGWAISMAPVITANWTLPQNKWTVPLGGGVSKTFKNDGQLMSLSVLYYTNVVRPLTSPQTTLRVSWSLLWPVKRGIDIQELLQESK
ncbi:MAG: neuromedin U [Candidatus Eremiobacteraeota bacterium]|nr:neuromedin U [Candidatus Eremiobacteraeota bacterium]